MKKSFPLLLASILIQAGLAAASTPPEAVPGIDKSREGDLAKKVAAFYEKSNPNTTCVTEDIGKSTVTALKLDSNSVLEEKTENPPAIYEATYLVVSVCNTGSTFAGAYRDVSSAAIVYAKRHGIQKNGVIKPDKADEISVIRSLDPASLKAPEYL